MPVRTTALGIISRATQIVSSVRQGLAVVRVGSTHNAGATLGAGATGYCLLDNIGLDSNAVEATRNMTVIGVDCTLKSVWVNVATNAASTANSEVQFRAGGSDKGTAVDITKSVTGYFASTGLTESINDDDAISLKVTNGGGGNLIIDSVGAIFEWTGA